MGRQTKMSRKEWDEAVREAARLHESLKAVQAHYGRIFDNPARRDERVALGRQADRLVEDIKFLGDRFAC